MASPLRRLLAALASNTRRPEYRVEDRLATFGVAATIICGIATMIFGDDDGQIAIAAALILITTIITWAIAKTIRWRQRP